MRRKIILASQSPRRRELLAAMGVQFTVVPSNFAEHLDDSRTPETVAMELAVGKASTVAELHQDAVVIGPDTIVTIDGVQLEKPHSPEEALAMLQRLAGRVHAVTTGVAVIQKSTGVRLVAADMTDVYFKPYNEAAAKAYVQTGDPLDKAGGYGIQSGAAPLVDHIAGQYDTVIGLPTQLLAELLNNIGITATPALVKSPVRQILA